MCYLAVIASILSWSISIKFLISSSWTLCKYKCLKNQQYLCRLLSRPLFSTMLHHQIYEKAQASVTKAKVNKINFFSHLKHHEERQRKVFTLLHGIIYWFNALVVSKDFSFLFFNFLRVPFQLKKCPFLLILYCKCIFFSNNLKNFS